MLNIQGHALTVGVPEVSPLLPSPALTSRLVVIKHHLEISTFLPAVLAELQRLEINGTAALVARTATGSVEGTEPSQGQPARDPFIRRTLRIADKEIVGFALTVSELSTEDSLKLQTVGLGGRRHFGCGVFVPVK
jgi:CRISPR-associated protein Cas6